MVLTWSKITQIFTYLIILSLYLSLNVVEIRSDCASLDKNVTIRDRTYLYALECRWPDESIKINTFSSTNNDQRWRLEPSARTGLFNIICSSTGEALDLSSTYDPINDYYNATTNVLGDTLSQQWFIDSSGYLVNAAAINHALNVNGGNYTIQNILVVQQRDSNSTKFEFVDVFKKL